MNLCSFNLSTYQPINLSTYQPINLSTYQPINLCVLRGELLYLSSCDSSSTKKDSRQAGMTEHRGHGLLVHSGLACPRLSRIDRILLLLSLSFWLVQNPSSYPTTSDVLDKERKIGCCPPVFPDFFLDNLF